MAAPSGTVWGAIAGGYGRIGIYKSLSSTDTQTTLTVQVWFWSKYSVSDSSNTMYFDNLSASGSATTSVGSKSVSTGVQSGSGWDTANQQQLYSNTYTYTRGTAAATRYIYARLINIDRVGAAMTVSTTATIPKLASYNVAYNANGGTGAPSSQTKLHGKAITLSSTKPTRTGYAFKGWATSASGAVVYAPGASYTANAAVTLYAVWQANTYSVTYNANGGTGAPGSQTKTHGTTLKLSSTKPTRTNYTFKGWGTSASSTTVAYAAGANYTANASLALFAIWELNYVKPVIYNFTATRCTADGTTSDDGTYAKIAFEWKTTPSNPTITITTAESASISATIAGSGTSGTVSKIIAGFSTETTYTVIVKVDDAKEPTTASIRLNSSMFPIDFLAGGKGVAFGKAADTEGLADFAFDARFNKPVYGKALGMDRLPAIPENSDFNDYMEPGCYAVQRNDIAATCANIPVDRAGRLEVWSSTGEGIRLEQWSYLRQRYIPYNSANAVWEREVTRGADNVWHYYEWWQSSLTPNAAEKVYSKAAMTLGMRYNTTVSATGSYINVPFDQVEVTTSERLTMQSNSIRIGANISYVKVSGQVLVKCGATANDRHARIQKVSGSTTTSHAWNCSHAAASSNKALTLTPIIIPVAEGDLLKMVFHTYVADDTMQAGSSTNGRQTYLTVEEL